MFLLQSEDDEVVLACIRSLHKIFSLLIAQRDMTLIQQSAEIPEGNDCTDISVLIASNSCVCIAKAHFGEFCSPQEGQVTNCVLSAKKKKKTKQNNDKRKNKKNAV